MSVLKHKQTKPIEPYFDVVFVYDKRKSNPSFKKLILREMRDDIKKWKQFAKDECHGWIIFN